MWLSALSLFSASCLAITLYLAKKDPMLLQRRIRAGPAAEKDPRLAKTRYRSIPRVW